MARCNVGLWPEKVYPDGLHELTVLVLGLPPSCFSINSSSSAASENPTSVVFIEPPISIVDNNLPPSEYIVTSQDVPSLFWIMIFKLWDKWLLDIRLHFSHLPSHLSSHIVGFINELSSQLSSQLYISGNFPHGKLVQPQWSMASGTPNCVVYIRDLWPCYNLYIQ